MKTLLKNVTIIGVLLCVTTVYSQEVPIAERLPKKWVGQTMPEFNFKTIDNEKLSLDALKGEIIVFDFWFVGCAPCVKEMPELNKLVKKYDEEKVVFIAPSAFDNKQRIDAFLKKRTSILK